MKSDKGRSMSKRLEALRTLANSKWAAEQPVEHIQILFEAIEDMEAMRDDVLRSRMSRIVTAYDAYRGKGVMPAPREYSAVAEAIDAGREHAPEPAAHPFEPDEDGLCMHCGEHEGG